jgi:puromycin-sensitive aminopeptidase
VLADRMTAVEFLDMALQFGDETDLSVWQRLVAGLGAIDRMVDGDAREVLRTQVRGLVGPRLQQLGRKPASGDSDRDRELRGVLIEAGGVMGADPELQAYAREVVESVDHRAESAKHDSGADPSVLSAAITVVAAVGGEAEYDQFHQRFGAATTPQEELRYLYALAHFDDSDLVQRLVAATMTDEIRTQNAPYVLGRAMANRDNGALAWAFVRDNWDEVNARFPSNSIVRMLGGIRSFRGRDVADDVFTFFESHEVPQGDKQLAQHLERLEVNVALSARAADALDHHLTA